jgi:hypothetical protein
MTAPDEPPQDIDIANPPPLTVENKPRLCDLIYTEKSCGRLVSEFCALPFGLEPANIQGTDFSVSSCLKRLETGYTIYKYSYNTLRPKQVKIYLTRNRKTLVFTKQRPELYTSGKVRKPPSQGSREDVSGLKGLLIGG